MANLDEALERFQRSGFSYGAGLPNYGPMAAAGLLELGHDALIVGLIDVYAPRLPDLESATALSEAERVSALGDRAAFARWLASFEAALAARPWQQVLAEAAQQLSAGIGADAVHGVVRTAYGVRGLLNHEAPVRVRELAFGLAHWAACFVSEADSHASESVERDVLRERIRRDCIAGATRYLAEPSARAANAVWVTGPAAIGTLVDHLDAASLTTALACIEALAPSDPVPVSGDGPPGLVDDDEVERCAENVQEIAYRAACSLQEHAIPFVAACLREDASAPDLVLRRAAADAALRLSPAGYQAWR
jgi:hypothetical protein